MPVKIENVLLYGLEEVATVVGKHPNTVRTYCQEGQIEAQKINGAWHVTRKNLEEVVKEMNFPTSIIELRLGTASPHSDSKPATST